jgi:hypothetical protein
MPRNIPRTLTDEENARVRSLIDVLAEAVRDDVPVRIDYDKRPDPKTGIVEQSHSFGRIDLFLGKYGTDTFSVNIVDKSKNPPVRTINMVRIRTITF